MRTLRPNAHAAAVCAPEIHDPLAFDDRDRGIGEDSLRQDVGDHPSGSSPLGMYDPCARMPALQAETGVEVDAELDQVAHARRRLGRHRGDRARPAEPPPGAMRVLGVQLGAVVLAERRRHSTLGEEARRGEQRSLREHDDVRLVRGDERRNETGDTPADDRDICLC